MQYPLQYVMLANALAMQSLVCHAKDLNLKRMSNKRANWEGRLKHMFIMVSDEALQTP